MEDKKKFKIIIAIIVIVAILSGIYLKNTKTIIIESPFTNDYTISGEIIEFRDIVSSLSEYLKDMESLTMSEDKKEHMVGIAKPTYSFSEVKKIFETDYKKICQIYNKAYKQVEDNAKISIAMENYKECLDIIYEGLTTGKLHEDCNTYIDTFSDVIGYSNDFLWTFSDDYKK